jgi:GLPGLI family protein
MVEMLKVKTGIAKEIISFVILIFKIMNKLFLIVFFLFFKEIYTQNFQGRVFYKTLALKDLISSDTIKKRSKEVADILSFTNESVKNNTLNFELKFSNGEALFEKIPTMKNDIGKDYEFAEIIFGAKNIYYTNIKTREKLVKKEAYGSVYLVSNNINDLNWTLTNEQKNIGIYVCLKATTSLKIVNTQKTFFKKIIAWYSPDIPVSFGPKGYTGLPGLILEINEDKLAYTAYKLILNPREKVQIIKPKNGKVITQNELDKIGYNSSFKNKKN